MTYDKKYIEHLIEKFIHQTLSKPEWTHEAHLITAIWYIKNYDYFEAVCRLKAGIILLNSSHHNHNTSSTGYHETITIFWTKVISIYVKLARVSDLEELVKNFLHSPLSNHQLPFEFYSKQRLMTADLRAIYAVGDLNTVDELSIKLILNAQAN